jgi:predicted negative regulator of RcsB-dependent stress response
MRDDAWKWIAIVVVVINIAYWGWQGWQWKQLMENRVEQIERIIIKMHPEVQGPPPQPADNRQ